MIRRLAVRTLGFMVLSVLAFALMERMTVLTGWPEVMQGMRAAAILTWAEISVMWIRICMSPQLDVQKAARAALDTHNGHASAIVYAVHQVTWCARLAAVLVLGWVL